MPGHLTRLSRGLHIDKEHTNHCVTDVLPVMSSQRTHPNCGTGLFFRQKGSLFRRDTKCARRQNVASRSPGASTYSTSRTFSFWTSTVILSGETWTGSISSGCYATSLGGSTMSEPTTSAYSMYMGENSIPESVDEPGWLSDPLETPVAEEPSVLFDPIGHGAGSGSKSFS